LLIKSIGNTNLPFVSKNSQHGVHYKGERTQETIIRFALDRINIHIPEISASQWELFLHGKDIVQRPMLIFICGDQQNCFTPDERSKVAATFVNVVIFTEMRFYQNTVTIILICDSFRIN